MPNWKKVVISGSSPEFNNVTLDGTLNIPGFSNLSSSLASLEASDSTKITNANLVYTSSGIANSSQPTHITNVDESLKVIATGSRSVVLNASKNLPNIISGSHGQYAAEVIVNGISNVIKQTGAEGSTVVNTSVAILNGSNNLISSSVDSSILAGSNNKIHNGRYSIIGGGNNNCLIGDFYSGGSCVLIGNSIVGGQHNRISGSSNAGNTNWWNTIGGGEYNRLYQTGCSIIGAGHCNRVLGNSATFNNSNKTYKENSIVGGRCNDIIDERNSHIIGGACNKICGDSTQNTVIQGSGNIIGAGHCNVITGSCCSAILGGKNNCLKHDNSFIIGSNLTSSAGCTTFVNNLCISGSLNGSTITGVTASFGKYIGIPSSDPFPYTASSGPAIISQSFTAGNVDSTALRLLGSGSVSQSGIFEVEGSAGPLFSVQDGLDGVLMEVNNISGLPLFQVSSSNEVFINRGNLTSGTTTATASFAHFTGSFQGDGSQLTGISAGTNLTQSIFVTQNGDDTTGTIGDITKPFATLESASQAATIGSTIFVYPGTYTPAENLAREGVNYYFQPGTTVSSSYAGAIFDVEGFRTSPYGFNVYGNADFHFHTSADATLWEAGAASAEVTFDWTLEFQDVTTTSDVTDTIIRLGGTGQTSRIKFRDANIQSTFIRNDASYTDTQKIKVEGNCFNSANGGFYTQGGNGGPAYMQIDMAYVYAGGSAHAFANIGYSKAILFNIAYCYGPSGAYQFSPSPGSHNYNVVINGYANEINITGQIDIVHNGDCDELVMSNGRYVGSSVKKFSLSGGESRFAINYQSNQANSVSVSGGVHTIEMVENQTNYEHIFSISGGKCILVGYNRSAYSNGQITVSGGELIFKGHIEYAYAQNGSGRRPFNVTGGLLRMQGYAKNQLTDSDPSPQDYSVIKYTGGDIILDGATLVVSSSIAPPIWASDQTREVKIYSGGVNTNKTGSMGLLAASSSFGSGAYALTNPLGGMIIEDASVE